MNSELLNNKINSIIDLYSKGFINDALETVETLLNEYPNESLLHNISGVCYKATGQFDSAVNSFKRAIAIKQDFADAHYNLGLTFQELNQLDSAIKSYEETLALQINYSKAHNNLGTIYREIGNLDQSVRYYEKAIGIQPDFAEAHNNLGNALIELDNFDYAIKSYEQALIIKSDYFEVHNNLGNLLHELGNYEDAINYYDEAIAINPNYAEAHNNLGNTLNKINQFYYAIECYEKAIAINSEYYEAYNNLGTTYNKISQLDKAVDCYEMAISINSKYAVAYYNLGVSLNELGQTDKAINFINQALSINPDYAEAHNDLGTLFQELGQSDNALNCYVNALAIEPDNAQFHRNLATLKHYKEGDTQLIHMETLLTSVDLTQSDRISLCFALAKAYKDLGRKNELFKVLKEGNSLRKKELNYSIEDDLKKHLIYKNYFKSTSIEIQHYNHLNIRPIFIIGMPRSGTTLVEQIISSHRKVYGGGELSYLDTHIDPLFKDYLTQNKTLSEEKILSIRQGYLNKVSILNISESIITDKMPTNFENIGFILKAFPEAKIVHLKRNAMAVCWSIYQRYFPTKGIGFPYDMEDLAQFYKSYNKMMDFWHALFPNKIYDITYEDLTKNQEYETRKLLEYCELEWDENCLNFHTNNRAIKTASSIQVKEKIYQGSSDAWKNYTSQLRPLINSLGYIK